MLTAKMTAETCTKNLLKTPEFFKNIRSASAFFVCVAPGYLYFLSKWGSPPFSTLLKFTKKIEIF